MSSYSTKTETFYVLVTDNTARLVFYTKESADKYLAKTIKLYPTSTIQKVYGETKFVEVEAQ